MDTTKVYIMSLPRSGSTLIGQQLGMHEDIVHMGETMYWELLSPRDKSCSCGKRPCPILMNLGKEITSQHMALPLLKAWQATEMKYWPEKKWVAESSIFTKRPTGMMDSAELAGWLDRCPQALDKIVSIYKKEFDASVIVDNTKLFAVAERLVDRPSWKILILLRDPRGVMASYKKAGERKGDMRDPRGIIKFCEDFMQSVSSISKLDNSLIVRYEDFCDNPPQVLKEICSFLNEPYENRVVKPFNRKEGTAGHVLMGNRILWKDALTNFQIDTSWEHGLDKREIDLLTSHKSLMSQYAEYGYSF